MAERWGQISTRGGAVAPMDSREVYLVYETSPSSLIQIDSDSETLDTVLGPVVTGTGSVGLYSWEEGGAGFDTQQIIATHTPYTPGTNYWEDTANLRFKIHPSDLSTASTEVDTDQIFIKGTLKNGGNAVASGNDKFYVLVGTEYISFDPGGGTVHSLAGLKIVEVELDGTIARTFDFPEPSDWFTGAMTGVTPFYQYPGEDGVSIPSLCITPDGSTIYCVAMKPNPSGGENTWYQGIFKCDVSTGTITEFIPGWDSIVFIDDIHAFMTTNWPEETYQENWDPYYLAGMACAVNGDLLLANQSYPIVFRVDSTGAIVQLIVGQNAPASPADELYATTGINMYDGIQGITAKGNKIYVLAEAEVYIDDGGGLAGQSSNYEGDSPDHWLVSWEMPDPETTPISLVPTTGFPRHMLDERPYVIWAG